MMALQIDKDAFRDFERNAHDRIAASYNDLFVGITERATAPLLEAAQVRSGLRVLDVAAGPGRLTSAAAAMGALAIGCDLAPAMVDLARALNPGIRFDQASADALPYPAASFDALVCAFGIGHFPDPEGAVAEFARVVAPGGFAALSWWESFSRNRVNGIFHEVLATLGVSASGVLPQGPPMDRFSSAQAFAELIRAAAFTKVHVASVASTYRLSNVDQLWELAMGSFARASSLIMAQNQGIQRAIRSAVGEAAQQYMQADGLHIPIAFLVASGQRPLHP